VRSLRIVKLYAVSVKLMRQSGTGVNESAAQKDDFNILFITSPSESKNIDRSYQ